MRSRGSSIASPARDEPLSAHVTHLDLPLLIQTYGYPAAFIGAMLEGETVLVLAGLAAHRGHLSLPTVWLLAAAGGAIGDAIYFALGRRYGEHLIARFPWFAPAVERIHRLIERGPVISVIGVRFLYGVRMAGPVVIGTSAMSWPHFLFWNAFGALLWSAAWLAAGYMLGEVAQRLLGNLAHVERELFGGVLMVAIVVAIVVRLRARRMGKVG
jgi:membrane protein DedA with SNARE-associated domain